MVLEADYRPRVPHSMPQGPQGVPPQGVMPPQQNWGVPYQRQVPGLPPGCLLMQPGTPFTGPYGVHMQGMPYQGPVMYPMNGPAPAHLLGMHHPGQHHPWGPQPFVQHPQHVQQLQMQAARRLRHSAPNLQPQHARGPLQAAAAAGAGGAFRQPGTPPLARPGALGMQQQPMAAAAGIGAAAASGNPAVSKSAARAVLVNAGPGRQAAAGGGPLSARNPGATAGACLEALKYLDDSCAESDSECGDYAQSAEACDGSSGWAWLVDGLLQQIVGYLQGNSTSLSAFRATCVNWRSCVDTTILTLSPKALLPKDLIRMFPKLESLQLVSCRNVRNRDLYVLANNDLHLTSLILGDDTNKPWVTNRGIESIAKMTHLKFLALHDCNSITNNGITAMAALTSLDTLSLRGCRKLTNNGLNTIKALTNLTKLNLYGCKRLSDAGMADLVNLPLRALALGLTRMRDNGMVHIARLTQLTELHLVKEEISHGALKGLSSLTALEVLSLRDMRLSNQAVQIALSALTTKLRDLSLYRNCDVTSTVLVNNVSRLENFSALDLRETGVDENGLMALTSLLSLRVLKLKPHPNLLNTPGNTLANFLHVKDLTQLTSLSVSLPVLHTAMMESIGQLTGLQELDLGRGHAPINPVVDECVMHAGVYGEVAKLTRLTSLDLSRRRAVDRAEAEERKKGNKRPKLPRELRQMLEKLPRLCYLNLGSTGIEAPAVKRLICYFPAVTVDGRKSMSESTPDLSSYGLAGTLCVL